MQHESTTRRSTTEDLTGQPFHSLTVTSFGGYDKGTPLWYCACVCGTIVRVRAGNLKSGHTQSCGCAKTKAARRRTKDLTGETVHWLTVLDFAGYMTNGRAIWRCQCRCGEVVLVPADSLINKSTYSCGHHRGIRPDETPRPTRIIERYPEFSTWKNMLNRCLNPYDPSYERYGGRGITVCERWQASFENFLEDMGPRPSRQYTLDRVDNSAGYSKENCKWATRTEQSRNRRSNHLITFNGQTKPLSAWAEELGMKWGTLDRRIARGMPIEEALTRPVAPMGFYHARRRRDDGQQPFRF